MHYVTFGFRTLHDHAASFYDYLALRKRFFVDTLGWAIPHDEAVEMDQYDNPKARYVLVIGDEGEVLAGARALPTSARWGDVSYMLRDAQAGRIGGIPADLLGDRVLSDTMYECTRLVISPELTGMQTRVACLGLICRGLVDLAMDDGATELMSLSNLWLLRALKSLGYDAELMCDPYVNCDDGHKYAVMKMSAMYVDLPLAPVTRMAPAAGPSRLMQRAVLHAPAT